MQVYLCIMLSQKRIMKELNLMRDTPPDGIRLLDNFSENSFEQFVIEVQGAPETLYTGEQFQLRFKFGDRYPFEPPTVTFVGDHIPVHPHIYSNGHICLSILTEDWSPALTIESVCLSIISMLSSCTEKKRPPDDSMYVRTCSGNPRNTRWWFHDDNV